MSDRISAEHESKVVYETYEIDVVSFEFQVSAGVNATLIREASCVFLESPVYGACFTLEVMTNIVSPKRFKGDGCRLLMTNPSQCDRDWSELSVADLQRKDEHGSLKYLKRGRSVIPDLDAPNGIGEVWRGRKEDPWAAPIYVPFFVIQEFRNALSLGYAKKIFMQVRRTGLERWIQHVSYSTRGLYDN